jgi:hypothetical protein
MFTEVDRLAAYERQNHQQQLRAVRIFCCRKGFLSSDQLITRTSSGGPRDVGARSKTGLANLREGAWPNCR